MRVIAKQYCFFAYCRQFTLFYQFPFAVQTHAFLRGICRHLHFIRNHTKTRTFRHEMAKYERYFLKFMCFYVVLFALQKRHYLQWFRALAENHTIWALWALLGAAGLPGLPGLPGLSWAILANFLAIRLIEYMRIYRVREPCAKPQ